MEHLFRNDEFHLIAKGIDLIMKRFILLSLVSVIAACSTTEPQPPAAAPTPQAKAAPATAPIPSPAPAKASPVAQAESPLLLFDRQRAAISNASVYFAFDNYTVAPDQGPIVEKHANLAVEFPSDHLTLQGNCDERGGREYNLALGQQRAEAVKERLAVLGVPKGRMEAISFGKEKPRAVCHQDSCWSQDRRVDFVDSWK